MTEWTSEHIAYEPVFLALTRDDYTTGHWAPSASCWVGYALNQSPPYYTLEDGAVKYWSVIDRVAK